MQNTINASGHYNWTLIFDNKHENVNGALTERHKLHPVAQTLLRVCSEQLKSESPAAILGLSTYLYGIEHTLTSSLTPQQEKSRLLEVAKTTQSFIPHDSVGNAAAYLYLQYADMVHQKGDTPSPQSIENLELACAMESLGSTKEQTQNAALNASRYLLAVDKYVRDTFQVVKLKNKASDISEVLDSFVAQAKNMHISLRTDAINSLDSALGSLDNRGELQQAFDASLERNGLVLERNSELAFSM